MWVPGDSPRVHGDQGGWTFKKHAEDADKPGQNLHTQLTSEEATAWHAVMLQEQSQTSGFYVVNDALYDASYAGAASLNGRLKPWEPTPGF